MTIIDIGLPAMGIVAAVLLYKSRAAVGVWLRRRYAGYTPDGKFWLTIGVIALIVDVAIGFLAGFAQATFWHGVGFAMLAAGFAFLPDAAYEEYEKGRLASAAVVAALCLPIGIKAFEQQVTYSAGMRHGEIQHTNIVNARHGGAQDNVTEVRANFGLLKEQLAALQTERKNAVEANPWLTTSTAEALRAQLPVLDEKIANEAAGNRGRPKGCKTECEKLKDEKLKVQERIAAAERLSAQDEQIAKLTAHINKTKDVLDGARTKADTAEHRDSLNLSVAKFTAQIVNIARGASPSEAINADEVSIRYATLGSAGLGSFALLVLAPIGMFLAGRRRKPGFVPEDDHPATLGTGEPSVRPSAYAPPASNPLPHEAQTAPISPELARGIDPSALRIIGQHGNTTVTHRVLGAHALKEWAKRADVRAALL